MLVNSTQTVHAATTHSRFIPGGIGVIGGLRQSPKFLQGTIDELKAHLEDKNAPFGVDLLIPQIGGNARKTNVSLALRTDLTFRLIVRRYSVCSVTTQVVNSLSSLMSLSRAKHRSSSVLLVSPQSGPLKSFMQLVSRL